MNPQDEKQETAQTSAYDPFPKPQTIPSGWDTSELFASPGSASVEQVDHSAENEAE
jgi:hypothetical protein